MNESTDRRPVAWAVQTGFPPRNVMTSKGVISGTGHFWWWLGTRKDYQRAIDEVILQQFPKQLLRCSQQHLPGYLSSKCQSLGYEPCRGGGCCCPVGYRVEGDHCVPCAVVEQVKALHDLPLVYILHPESGRFAFYLMCFLGMVLLPLPWAIFAQIAWRQLRSSDQDHVRHYLVHHQREAVAKAWRSQRRGPMAVTVSSMSGQTKELSGFFSTSLLAHLRRAVADAFGVPFRSCQLVVRQQILHPEMDFKTLSDANISHGSSLFLVCSNKESRRHLAGSSECNALSFFGRTAQVYKALECKHSEQLRMQRATAANLGEKYTQGWQCDGCERHFEAFTNLWRCEVCVVDFCSDCANLTS
ncbi:unnamed protein product [Durusdinium trenchii]|uniref:Ubiquitin-like domain-containing protein n=1 Tax=Durusdinium trenchii TaxID=1381693 RepID=A0ABP0RC39_9DINO